MKGLSGHDAAPPTVPVPISTNALDRYITGLQPPLALLAWNATSVTAEGRATYDLLSEQQWRRRGRYRWTYNADLGSVVTTRAEPWSPRDDVPRRRSRAQSRATTDREGEPANRDSNGDGGGGSVANGDGDGGDEGPTAAASGGDGGSVTSGAGGGEGGDEELRLTQSQSQRTELGFERRHTRSTSPATAPQ